MPMMTGQTAAVTGAARGIGRAIAEALGAEGAHVVAMDVQPCEDTIDAVEAAGGSAEARTADVTDEAALEAAFDGLDLDVLVNNAAYYAPLVGEKQRFDALDRETWETVMAVNVTGTWLASKHALPRFADDGGSLVNIASTVAVTGTTGFLHYVASKGAVLSMSRSMANELGPLGIRVNAVLPGFTASEASLQAGESYLEGRVERQALDRPIEPRDIADAVAFLAGPKSAMITGQALPVEGGRSHY